MAGAAEVVVIGGGPGGATLAGLLAQRNRRVILFEREQFPRFHIGESLLPKSREVFDKLGISDEIDRRFLRKYGARFLCAKTGKCNQYSFADAFDGSFEHAYEVPRDEFDQMMLEHAKTCGADVRERWEVTEVIFEGERAVGVRAKPRGSDQAPETFEAPVVVDCTGRDTLLAGRLRQKSRVPGLDRTALFSHYRGTFRQEGQDEGNIQIVIFDHGWFWFIPFRGDVTSVGTVVSSSWMKQREKGESLDDLFARTVAEAPLAGEFLEGAEKLRPVGALADFSYRVKSLTGDGWLMAGDSSGFLDPLFSTGAHLAFKSADIAADAIDKALESGDTSAAAFADYEAAVRYAIELFLEFVQGFYAGHFQKLLFQEKQRPTLRKLITSVLAGDVFHHERKPAWVSFLRQYRPEHLAALTAG